LDRAALGGDPVMDVQTLAVEKVAGFRGKIIERNIDRKTVF